MLTMLSNAQDADPFGGGNAGKASKGVASDDPFASPGGVADDPFAPSPGNRVPKVNQIPVGLESVTVEVVYEVFSLPQMKAAKMLRMGLKDSDFYNELVAGVSQETAGLEKMMIAQLRPGQVATVEQITERIFNTEVEPPEMMALNENQDATKGGGEKGRENWTPVKVPALPAVPTSFDTKKVGDILEVELMIDSTAEVVGILLNATHVGLPQFDSWGKGLSEVKMPRFTVQRLNLEVLAANGAPTFAGTVSPPSELQRVGAPVAWVAFVTAKVSQHQPTTKESK